MKHIYLRQKIRVIHETDFIAKETTKFNYKVISHIIKFLFVQQQIIKSKLINQKKKKVLNIYDND